MQIPRYTQDPYGVPGGYTGSAGNEYPAYSGDAPPARRKRRVIFAVIAVVVVLVLFSVSAPSGFPDDELITIHEGMTLKETARLLEEKSVIRSGAFFQAVIRMSSGEGSVKSGVYFFDEPQSVFGVARRIARALFGLESIKVTIPEGLSMEEMANLLERKLPDFSWNAFVKLAKDDEGYLFPDTYSFLPNTKAETVYKDLRENFEKKRSILEDELAASQYTLHEIITMAALIEEEAVTLRDRRMVSGILWKRLEEGMALQVDATFLYINGKKTYELTLKDLRETDSPYNTYKYTGLPPGPITNPGLESIRAALDPLPSDYWYYLSDEDGTIHYSRTFEEHKRKKELYL